MSWRARFAVLSPVYRETLLAHHVCTRAETQFLCTILFTCTVTLVTRHTMRDWSVRSFISTARVIRWCARHRLHPHNAFPFHFCCCHLPHQVQVCYATIYLKPCEDPLQDGGFPNLHCSTVFEPTPLLHSIWAQEDRAWQESLVNPQNTMIDDQDYMEEIRVEHFIVALQSMTYSAYDSAESIAPDSDFDDEQIRKMLASPLYKRNREESEGQKSSSLLWTRNLNDPLNDPVFLESRSFRETRCEVCTEARSKSKATSSLSLRTRKLVDRFVPRDQSLRETWCDVSMSRCLQICWPGNCWEITSWWKQGSFA